VIDSHLLNQNTPRAAESVIIAGYFSKTFQAAIYPLLKQNKL